jgi:hypothetical protein
VGGVLISLRGPSGQQVEAMTPNDGAVRFEELDEGAWEIDVSPPRYFEIRAADPASRALELSARDTVRFDAFLAPIVDPGTRLIRVRDEVFDPARAFVLPGTWVLWVNQSSQRHSLTPDGHAEWSAAVLGAPGETFGAVMNNPGVYELFSEFGPDSGMRGVVEVDTP